MNFQIYGAKRFEIDLAKYNGTFYLPHAGGCRWRQVTGDRIRNPVLADSAVCAENRGFVRNDDGRIFWWQDPSSDVYAGSFEIEFQHSGNNARIVLKISIPGVLSHGGLVITLRSEYLDKCTAANWTSVNLAFVDALWRELGNPVPFVGTDPAVFPADIDTYCHTGGVTGYDRWHIGTYAPGGIFGIPRDPGYVFRYYKALSANMPTSATVTWPNTVPSPLIFAPHWTACCAQDENLNDCCGRDIYECPLCDQGLFSDACREFTIDDVTGYLDDIEVGTC